MAIQGIESRLNNRCFVYISPRGEISNLTVVLQIRIEGLKKIKKIMSSFSAENRVNKTSMKKENWLEVEKLLDKAYDLKPAERRRFINEIKDEKLRHEVETLLELEDESEKFLDAPAVNIAADLFYEETRYDALAGKLIGNYRIIRELGHGGMGAVYLAERADGKFEQKVALKLLRRELNTTDIRRRFRMERQILARLHHPNIALLLDAGTTVDNIPFLAMEYVEGEPVNCYCRRNELDLKERLKLFQKVCETVAFAHRNLIVHRDLKPSNILVTVDGTPKLLDFGISKLLTSDYESEDFHTVTRLGAMTPEYAAPEQFRGESVSTAADIYSLGVILYEILTSRRPFEGRKNGVLLATAISETEPEKPSEAITRRGDAETRRQGENLARTEPNRPISESPRFFTTKITAAELRGDLDNIILKALKKEPERRYLSAEQFGEDIRRHLAGLPVLARPDTLSYRASKFVRRNKYGVLAAILILMAIFTGVAATLWQAKVAQTERDRAQRQAAKAERINEFLQNVLNFSNPHWTSSNPERKRKATISEAVDDAARRVETELAGEPEIQAEVQFTLGQSFFGQGRYDEAEKQFRSSMEKFAQTLGEEDPKTLRATLGLADVHLLQGRYAEADALYQKIIPPFRRAAAEDLSQSKWLAAALNDYGLSLVYQGKNTEAEPFFRESLDNAAGLSGADRSIIPIAMGNLAMTHRNRGDLQTALNLYTQIRAELREQSDAPTFEDGTVLNHIGIIQKMQGDYAHAEKTLLESHDIFVKTVGEEHQYAVYPVIQLADVYYFTGDYEKARQRAENALAIQQKLFPKGNPDLAYSKNVLGKISTRTGEKRRGEILLREALQIREKSLREPHFLLAEVKHSLGENLLEQEKIREAEKFLQEAEKSYLETVGENHPFTVKCREVLQKISRAS